MTTTQTNKMIQVVDWRAAFWAGVIAGTVFWLLNVFVTPPVLTTNAWVIVRMTASIVMGESVLAPPATFDPLITVVALLVHYVLSILFAFLVAYVVHRWGILVGILGGAALGLALYGINVYSMTLLFPWFFLLNSWIFLLTHVIFGALAGGWYESLEVERFVTVEA